MIKSDNSGKKSQKIWITIRFVSIIILQAIPRIGYNSFFLVVITNASPITQFHASTFTTISVILGYYLNMVMAFWSNKALRKWLLNRIQSSAFFSLRVVSDSQSELDNSTKSNTETTKATCSIELSDRGINDNSV